MKLIAGLGNPGPQYEKTRHNVGFLVLDSLARRYAPAHTPRARFHGLTIETSITTPDGDEKLLLLKPTEFMNRSGQGVAEAVRFYKMDVARDVLVVVDDVALPCGQIRVRGTGGTGGHNGLADIQEKLGSNAYARLRIGIDPPGQIPQKDYVLGRFRPDQLPLVEESLADAVDAAICWAGKGLNTAMNQFNQKSQVGATEQVAQTKPTTTE